MKHFYSGMLVTLALVLAAVMGLVALAETTEPEAPALPSVETPAESTTTDSTALQDALNAYNAARQSSRTEAIESELNDFVASGKLTQEQADLVLNYFNEQQALRNGTCPNCGYQFQTDGGFGKGGHGGKGNRGGKGGFGRMNGDGQQMNGQQPSYGQQTNNGQLPSDGQGNFQANGASFEDDWQIMPDYAEFEEI